MKKIIFLWITCILTGLYLSCSEDETCEAGVIELPNAVALVDGASYQAALLDCRIPKVQTFTLSGSEGGQVEGNTGTAIFIPPQSITNSDGALIDGPVTLELLEFYTNGASVACQLSTNTLNDANAIEPTLSKGMLYINLTSNGEQAFLNEGAQVFVPNTDTSQNLNQFTSPTCPNIECEVLWERNLNTEVTASQIDNPDGTVTTGYLTFIQDLGWISIAQYDQNPDRTIIYNKAPSGYALGNSKVFFVYEDTDLGIALLSYNDALNVFTESFSQIPIGRVGTFVFVSRTTTYQLATDTVLVSPEIIGVTLETSAVSESDLINMINNL